MRRLLPPLLVALAPPCAAHARPAFDTGALVRGFTPTPGYVSPGGTRAAIDLPLDLRMRNVGGSDGAGLCVPTSVTHSARWQNVPELAGFRDWLQTRPGGSYPEKFARDYRLYCQLKGIPQPRYVMATGDGGRLMELAYRTRRMPSITHTAAHMVSGVHLDAREGAILDNNGPARPEWAPRAYYLDVYSRPRYGWTIVVLAPPPPPTPGGVAPAPAPAVPPPPAPDCPDGRCPSRPRPNRPGAGDPKPVGPPPSPAHEWGWVDGAGWGWRLRRDERGEIVGGVDVQRIDATRTRYWVDGVEVTAAGQDAPLADDSGRYHLTVVVPDAAERARVLASAADLPGLDRVHLQAYTPADWPVRTGRVSAPVTLQEPAPKGGKVVKTAVRYDAATLADVLRYTDPDYRPEPDAAPAPRPVTPKPGGKCGPDGCPPKPKDCRDGKCCPCPGPKSETPAVKPETTPGPEAPEGESPRRARWLAVLAALLLLTPRR